VVQAEAAASQADARRDPSAVSFDAIAGTGRETLTELRTLLDVLRAEDQPASIAPQPGIDEIDQLVDQVRATGLDIDLAVEGDRRTVPPAVGLSAYRVIQEGLTNVIKHAHASRVRVAVRYRESAVELDVVDNGTNNSTSSTAVGHGLIGLRERVALLDGTLETRRLPTGGFELNVSLPVRD
jgi:signal transduction histidine kinase